LKGINSSDQAQKVKNCIIYDFSTTDSKGFYANATLNTMHYWYNNTVYNCNYGFYIGDYGTSADGYLKNNLADSCGINCFDAESPTSYWSMNYNASSDDTADDNGGTGNCINQTFAFVNEDNDNFHLAGGGILRLRMPGQICQQMQI